MTLTPELRDLIESGPLTHLTTIDPDGSPQVSVNWIGLDGDDLFTAHMSRYRKLRNIERDPRVVVSFTASRTPGEVMTPYVVLRARGFVTESDQTWDLLNRLTKTYVGSDVEFPAPRGPGYVVRYEIERITGIGPWAS